MYIPIYYFFIAPKNTFIEAKDLVQIHGTVQYLNFPRSSRDKIATLKLNENFKSYSFNMSGYYASHKIKFGDSVTILALKIDLQKDLNEVRSYELQQDFKQIFTVNAYNTSLSDSRQIYKILVWIAIAFIVLYVLIDKTKFIPKIKKLLDSPDPKFRPQNEEPNFNEFLDR